MERPKMLGKEIYTSRSVSKFVLFALEDKKRKIFLLSSLRCFFLLYRGERSHNRFYERQLISFLPTPAVANSEQKKRLHGPRGKNKTPVRRESVPHRSRNRDSKFEPFLSPSSIFLRSFPHPPSSIL